MGIRIGIGNLKIGQTKAVTNNISGIGFTTEWIVGGDATARTITLPLINTRTEGALAYDCIVDWGDGGAKSHVVAYNGAERIHTYASNGTYQVNITGTMEGWSFNNAGDKLKIYKIINWGESGVFNGFKSLSSGFRGCTNLTSLGIGKILASGTGVLSEGFITTFYQCKFATIPIGLFDNHTNLTVGGFNQTFSENTSLLTCPANLFDLHTALTTYAFNCTFLNCTSFAGIPTNLFKYNVNVTQWAFNQTFRNTAIISIPTDLFRYNTKVSIYGFRDTFQNCGLLEQVPTDIFRYNTLVSTHAFEGTFIGCVKLTTVPNDLFRYNTNADCFFVCFQGCLGLLTVPAGLFKYNKYVTADGFNGVFMDCVKLQLNRNIFYDDGDQAVRFLEAGINNMTNAFKRLTFSGTQGEAPDLWNCTFPETLELSNRPTTMWDAGDVITGQTSGAQATFINMYGTWKAMIKNRVGNFSSGEIIGVTGIPAKLKQQMAGYPIVASTLTSTTCFNGAGNSLTSISNYGNIPAGWK